MTLRAWQRVALAMFAVGWGANQFTPLLIAYRDELAMSAQTRAVLFGVYAVGLVPGLLLGGSVSDRWGRRAVVVPFVALSPLATLVLVLGAPGTRPTLASRPALLNLPAATRTRRFGLAVAPVAPWVFGCAAISFAFLPEEIGGTQTGELAFAGVLTGLTLGTGVLVQPLARRLDDRRALLADRSAWGVRWRRSWSPSLP